MGTDYNGNKYFENNNFAYGMVQLRRPAPPLPPPPPRPLTSTTLPTLTAGRLLSLISTPTNP